MLLRGLFMTSFLAEDFLSDADLYGASSVLISSASSKTSISLAFVVSKKAQAKAIGLTSARNVDFVKGTGFYDEVVTYDEIGGLRADVPAVFVDMAGRTTRAKIVSADNDSVRISASGIEFPLAWSQLTPKRFYGIARKYTDDHIALYEYCWGYGLQEDAQNEKGKGLQ